MAYCWYYSYSWWAYREFGGAGFGFGTLLRMLHHAMASGVAALHMAKVASVDRGDICPANLGVTGFCAQRWARFWCAVGC